MLCIIAFADDDPIIHYSRQADESRDVDYRSQISLAVHEPGWRSPTGLVPGQLPVCRLSSQLVGYRQQLPFRGKPALEL